MGSVARASNVPYLGDLRQELLDEGPVLGLQWVQVLQSAPMCSYDSLQDVGPILGQRACTVWLPWRSFFATPPQHLPNIQFKLNGSNPEHVATRVRARYGHGFAKRRME